MSLVLGPVLRHVGDTTAAVWVQVERRATVTVLGCSTPTFEVAGHHYALVSVTGLEPDTTYPYDVTVDGEVVWPPPVSPLPPSTLHTRGPASARRHRIVFGSCRYAKVVHPKLAARLGIDALDAFAAQTARQPREEWPDALLLLGDQVYADELTPQNRRRIAGRRDRHPEWPDDEIVGFDEYVGPLPRLVERPGGALAALVRAHRDDLRRSRRARRLEHLGGLAPGDGTEALVAGADPVGARVVLGLPAPGQPARRGARGRPRLPRDHGRRGRHVAAAGRPRGPGGRRDRRQQGSALQLPAGTSATAGS